MPESNPIKCPQCGMEDTGKFCSNCGYTFANKRLTMSFYAINLVDFFYNFEGGGYIYTLKNLFFRPLGVVHDFIAGFRKNYYLPTKYLLLNTGLNLLLFNLLQIDKIEAEQEGVSAMEEMLLKSDVIFNSFISGYGQFLIILIIPIFTLSSYIVFPKSPYNMAERAIPITYFFGQLMLIQMAINVLSYFVHSFVLYRPFIIRVLEIIAILMISRYFFKENFTNTLWKSVFIMAFIFFAMFMILYSINLFIQWQNPVDELLEELK